MSIEVRASFGPDVDVEMVDDRLDEIGENVQKEKPDFRGRHATTKEHIRVWRFGARHTAETFERLLSQDPELHDLADIRIAMRRLM